MTPCSSCWSRILHRLHLNNAVEIVYSGLMALAHGPANMCDTSFFPDTPYMTHALLLHSKLPNGRGRAKGLGPQLKGHLRSKYWRILTKMRKNQIDVLWTWMRASRRLAHHCQPSLSWTWVRDVKHMASSCQPGSPDTAFCSCSSGN